MDLVDGLGYIALAVPDLEQSLNFYRKIVHLQVSDRSADTAFLTGGGSHHWLRLDTAGAPGLNRIGFKMVNRDALDQATIRLDEAQVPWEEVSQPEADGITDAIRFRGPDGVQTELFTDMVSLPVPVTPFLNMSRVLHAVWAADLPERSAAFYIEVLGFKVSDWIERSMVFLRSANRYHHTIGISRASNGKAGRLDHFSILVASLDDVMRARNIAARENIALRHDLIRHAASGSISTYFIDPVNGISVEFCVDHRQIDDGDYQARILPAVPTTFDLWAATPTDRS